MNEMLDCRGLKCPQPVLKVAIKAHTVPAGSILEDRGTHQVATVQL